MGAARCRARGMPMKCTSTPGDDATIDQTFGGVAAYFLVLSEPTRLKIMRAICQRRREGSRVFYRIDDA